MSVLQVQKFFGWIETSDSITINNSTFLEEINEMFYDVITYNQGCVPADGFSVTAVTAR